MKIEALLVCLWIGAGMVVGALANEPAAQLDDRAKHPPNIVLILADDLGWADLGCYGSRFHDSPHLDRLASQGMRFTNAYAAHPLCSPTRASILTGLYPHRLGITLPNCHELREVLEQRLPEMAEPKHKAITPNTVTRLKTEHYTLSEAFNDAGYVTGHFGKWHLGYKPYDPRHHGFDVDVPQTNAPGPGGGSGFFAPWGVWKGVGSPGEHIEDRLVTEAANFIRANKDRPFFLNYWAFSVHSPWQAKAEYMRQGASKADPKQQQHNPLYYGMVRSLDDAVGRLMEELDAHGIADNTIVVFMSDNGGWIWESITPDYTPDEYEGIPITSNAPLRGGKATIYEGGLRVPCIVRWPNNTRPGSVSDAIISTVDLYPTLLEMASIKPKPDKPLDGASFVPALRGQTLSRDTAFFHFPHYIEFTGNLPAAAVRKGDWKLIRFFCDGPDRRDRVELYDLAVDIGEIRNLASTVPEKVRQLDALLDEHLRDTGAVIPVPNPAYEVQEGNETGG